MRSPHKSSVGTFHRKNKRGAGVMPLVVGPSRGKHQTSKYRVYNCMEPTPRVVGSARYVSVDHPFPHPCGEDVGLVQNSEGLGSSQLVQILSATLLGEAGGGGSSSKNPSPHFSCFLCSPMAFGCECPWIPDPVRFHRPYSVTVISSWQFGEGTQCHPLCYSTSTWL